MGKFKQPLHSSVVLAVKIEELIQEACYIEMSKWQANNPYQNGQQPFLCNLGSLQLQFGTAYLR
jgi:hypothetical protein